MNTQFACSGMQMQDWTSPVCSKRSQSDGAAIALMHTANEAADFLKIELAG